MANDGPFKETTSEKKKQLRKRDLPKKGPGGMFGLNFSKGQES